MGQLLASIVATRHLAPEPVATDALVHLLESSAAARMAVEGLLLEICPGADVDGLRFTGQEINPDAPGRPDIVGSDTSGTRIVIEAKFDAELTAAQLGDAYLQRLTPGVPGALVFLVPDDRLRHVWRRVATGPGGLHTAPTIDTDHADGGLLTLDLPTGHRLAAVTWTALINTIGAALTKAGDTSAGEELGQIEGLVHWRSRTGWTPLVPDDLPQRTGRQVNALLILLVAACQRVSAVRLKNGTADGGPGRYVTTATGQSIWVGLWFRWWDAYGPGPAWAQMKVPGASQLAILVDALTASGIDHHTRPQYSDVLIHLHVPPGQEKGAVEDALAVQLQAIAAVVDGIPVRAVEDTAVAQEPSADL